MIHIKIHCDDCGRDYDLTCEGIYFCMKNPSDRPEGSFLNSTHNIASLELLPEIMSYLLPAVLHNADETVKNVSFREWLKSMGVNLD